MNTYDVIWKNFKRNKRSIYSLYIFITLFVLSLFSELISNNKPIVMSIEGYVYYPYIIEYTERDFGGELETTPDYKGYFISDLLENKDKSTINNKILGSKIDANIIKIYSSGIDPQISIKRCKYKSVLPAK